jgi:hypothetical protein
MIIDLQDLIVRETPSGTIDGANTDFVLGNTPVSGSDQVFWNGVLQVPPDGYTLTDTTLAMTEAPAVGDTLLVIYAKT